MQYVVEGFSQVLSSNGFANAFWIFIGIVVGALVQYFFQWLTIRQQGRNALFVMKVEIEMNLAELQNFRNRLNYLRERISANQIQPSEIFVSMQGFDFSAIDPLVSSGHFHFHLGPRKAKAYFDFVRFFSNANGEIVNSVLRTDHEAGKSLDFIQRLDDRAVALGIAYSAIKDEY